MPETDGQDIEQLLNNAMSGVTPTEVEPTPETGAEQIAPESQPQAEPEQEAPQVEAPSQQEPEPEDEIEFPQDGGEKKGKTARFRFQNPSDQAVVLHAKANGLTLLEAAKQLAATQPEPTEAEPGQVNDDPVSQVNSELEDVRAQLDQIADENGDLGATITPAVRALQRREQELNRKLATLEARALIEQEDRAAEEHAQFQQADQRDEQRTLEAFPDLTNADSPLFSAVKNEVERLAKSNPDRLNDPDIRFTLAAKAAAELGIAAVRKASPTGGQTAAKPAQGVKPVAVFTPAPGSRSSSAHRIEVLQSDPLAEVTRTLTAAPATASLAEMDAMLGSVFGSGVKAGSNNGLQLLQR